MTTPDLLREAANQIERLGVRPIDFGFRRFGDHENLSVQLRESDLLRAFVGCNCEVTVEAGWRRRSVSVGKIEYHSAAQVPADAQKVQELIGASA